MGLLYVNAFRKTHRIAIIDGIRRGGDADDRRVGASCGHPAEPA
ncbi:hypothetical protein SALB1_2024 [Salinisphaera sp. LB1]|nr:hypothetical protein SALB1_2024 [Salinisphaera sp. LB1]